MQATSSVDINAFLVISCDNNMVQIPTSKLPMSVEYYVSSTALISVRCALISVGTFCTETPEFGIKLSYQLDLSLEMAF
jgi:hypothetical protein